MPQHTLYAYVDGSDLHDIANELEAELTQLVDDSEWRNGRPWVVNRIHNNDPSLGPGDLPHWDLGLNLDLPDPDNEPPGWFADVERIALFLGALHEKTGRDFVIGIGDNQRGYSEDLFFIDTKEPNVQALRQVIGVKEVD